MRPAAPCLIPRDVLLSDSSKLFQKIFRQHSERSIATTRGFNKRAPYDYRLVVGNWFIKALRDAYSGAMFRCIRNSQVSFMNRGKPYHGADGTRASNGG